MDIWAINVVHSNDIGRFETYELYSGYIYELILDPHKLYWVVHISRLP